MIICATVSSEPHDIRTPIKPQRIIDESNVTIYTPMIATVILPKNRYYQKTKTNSIENITKLTPEFQINNSYYDWLQSILTNKSNQKTDLKNLRIRMIMANDVFPFADFSSNLYATLISSSFIQQEWWYPFFCSTDMIPPTSPLLKVALMLKIF